MDYIKSICQPGYDRIDSLLIIQSPAINITATQTISSLTNYLTLQLYTVVPNGANITNDFCLGRIDDIAYVWQCYTRNLQGVVDGRFLYFVQEPGAYAVLFDPLNVTLPPTWVGVDTLWIANDARLLCLYVVLIFALVLFITLSLWCVSIQMVEYNRTEKELREYQKMLRDLTGGGTRECD